MHSDGLMVGAALVVALAAGLVAPSRGHVGRPAGGELAAPFRSSETARRTLVEPPRTVDTTAVGVVRAFYTFHLSHTMGFSAAAARRRAAWLAPDLLALCRAYFAAPSNPEEVPSIDGDPFTDSQEYPHAFRVGLPVASRDSARVPVTFLGPGAQRRTVTVVLAPARGSWHITDVRYATGPSLRRLLAAGP